MPEYVERFFLDAARGTRLEVEQRADGLYRIPGVPQRFRAPSLRAVQRYGPARDRYLKATFRKEQRVGKNLDAELLSPGHPLYAAVVELFEAKLGPIEGSTALYLGPTADAAYYLHAFEVGVLGESAGLDPRASSTETIDARFVPVIEHLDGTYELASQDIFHDLTPLETSAAEKTQVPDGVDIELGPISAERARKASMWVRLKVQHGMVKEQQARRADDARVRREYLERAFDARIHRLRQTEIELYARAGEEGGEGRLRKHLDEIEQTEHRKAERLRAVDRLAVARAGDVRHLATVCVLPLLWLQRNRPGEVGKLLQASGADLAALRLLAQALGGRPLRAEPTPGAQKDERSAEQRAVDTLLASFSDVARATSAGPLFDRVRR